MFKTTATTIALITFASAASAVTFSGTAAGDWTNPDATQGYGIYNYDQGNANYDQSYVFWGYTDNCTACTSFNNYWSFDGVGSDGDPAWSTVDDTLFHFGDLSYRNGSVYGHDFSGADLNIDLSLASPTTVVKNFSFGIEVENVPNDTGNAVTDGDIARIVGAVPDQYFSFDGAHYTLELMGFSRDNGATLSSEFQVAEATTDTVGLYGRITEIAPVPVPASLPLILLGMAPFAWGARRRS